MNSFNVPCWFAPILHFHSFFNCVLHLNFIYNIFMNCARCGKIYKLKRNIHWRRFCSQNCQQKGSSKNKCLRCKKIFLSNSHHPQKYCSKKCSGPEVCNPNYGSKHHSWKGGRSITTQGYFEVMRPDHFLEQYFWGWCELERKIFLHLKHLFFEEPF